MELKAKILLLTIIVAGIILAPLVVSESSDTGTVSIEINDNLEITVHDSPMTFALDQGIADENGSSNTPFTIENAGSVKIDVSTCASTIPWNSDTNDINVFQWISDENEATSCDTIMPSPNDTNWTDFNCSSDLNSTQVCEGFNTGNTTDSIKVGIYLRSPSDEPTTTSTSSTVTFYIATDTTADDDARSPC